VSWHATILTLFPEMFPGPLGISLLATLYPSNSAARVLPAEALRYE